MKRYRLAGMGIAVAMVVASLVVAEESSERKSDEEIARKIEAAAQEGVAGEDWSRLMVEVLGENEPQEFSSSESKSTLLRMQNDLESLDPESMSDWKERWRESALGASSVEVAGVRFFEELEKNGIVDVPLEEQASSQEWKMEELHRLKDIMAGQLSREEIDLKMSLRYQEVNTLEDFHLLRAELWIHEVDRKNGMILTEKEK